MIADDDDDDDDSDSGVYLCTDSGETHTMSIHIVVFVWCGDARGRRYTNTGRL